MSCRAGFRFLRFTMRPAVPSFLPTVDSISVMRGFGHESVVNKSVEWFTPPHIFEALNIEFDLDPCSPAGGGDCVPAVTKFCLPEKDGLVEPWFGRVWVNPPYGRETGVWLRKLAEHGDGVALVFARTGTKWFQQVAAQASLVCFVAGRIRFVSGDTGQVGDSPGADSMLLAFGEHCAVKLSLSGLGVFGRMVSLDPKIVLD